MKIKAMIWDLGGVLIDWKPDYVFDQLFDKPEEKEYFLQHICNMEWNENQDAGYPISKATSELIKKHPEWKSYIEAYYGRWTEMLGGPIDETVALFKTIRESGKYKLYALTNWSAELFPIALERYDFLHWFDGRVVSGEEKMRKPHPEFFQLLLERYGLEPSETIFIDDNQRNIDAAKLMGINAILFETPAQLEQELEAAGISPNKPE